MSSERSGASTSQSLLAGARGATPEAWERLVRLYAPLAAAWCRRWGVAEQDIADILQEVFAAVARHLERFRKDRAGDTFRGWLATITRNKVNDHFRRRAGEPSAAGGTEGALRLQQVVDPEASADEIPDDAAFDAVLHAALESIRTEFQPRTWQAFWLVVVEGHTAAAAAEQLAMTPGAVRVAKSRVLLRLRQELGDEQTF